MRLVIHINKQPTYNATNKRIFSRQTSWKRPQTQILGVHCYPNICCACALRLCGTVKCVDPLWRFAALLKFAAAKIHKLLPQRGTQIQYAASELKENTASNSRSNCTRVARVVVVIPTHALSVYTIAHTDAHTYTRELHTGGVRRTAHANSKPDIIAVSNSRAASRRVLVCCYVALCAV